MRTSRYQFTGFILTGFFLRGYYQYNQEILSEKEELRKKQLDNQPTSGIFVEERTAELPFPFFLMWINNYLPYHVSLIFPESSYGTARHVGLGPLEKDITYEGFFPSLMTHWRKHEGSAYQHVKPGTLTPVERWNKFYRYFGYYPNQINEEKLRLITQTPKEGGKLQGFFITPMTMPKSQLPRISNCQTKALAAVHESTSSFTDVFK